MDIWCWWCCHPFDGEPLSMPYHHDELRNKFITEGHFCSWSCTKAYAIDKYSDIKGSIISGNIIVMRKKMYNILGPVKIAPKRQMLKQFGGPMTIEEFRANATKDVGEVKQVLQKESIPERLVSNISNKKKLDEIKNASGSNETLKLKRNKPLKRDQNNLETALGLIVKSKT
ncbi:hypothetical protein [Dishui Lake phycodnavirus 4]|nr:hypothetical protein [Dishui Lake phycodnavirus 4]